MDKAVWAKVFALPLSNWWKRTLATRNEDMPFSRAAMSTPWRKSLTSSLFDPEKGPACWQKSLTCANSTCFSLASELVGRYLETPCGKGNGSS